MNKPGGSGYKLYFPPHWWLGCLTVIVIAGAAIVLILLLGGMS